MSEVIEDMGIDGLRIVQDTDLYRFTSDSVLLSRFARAKKGDRVADFCAGSGIVAFHFHALNRQKNLSYVLFELQEKLIELSKKTAELNGFSQFSFCQGKLQEIPEAYRESFSLILCNLYIVLKFSQFFLKSVLTTVNAIWYIQGAREKRKIHRCKQENAVRRNTVIYGGDIIYT